jgi:hypothetical protein
MNETATAVAALRAGDNWQVLCDDRGSQTTMIAGHGESISSLITIADKTICSTA